MSVPTVDEDAWRALEPGTAHPLQRLRAVRQLRDAGVNAGVLMAPVVPGFTTQPAKLEATIKAIADHGAAFMGANVLYLKGGTQDHFMGFLAREFPHMVESYQRLYAGAYAAKDYVQTVRGLIDVLAEALRRRSTANREGVEKQNRRPRSRAGRPRNRRRFDWLSRVRQAIAANAGCRPSAGSTSISTRPSRTSATNACPSRPALADRQLDLGLRSRASGSARRRPGCSRR